MGFEVDDIATVKEGDASAGDMRGLDEAVHCRIDLGGRKVAPVRASDCGLRRGDRSCEQQERENWDVQGSMQAEISLVPRVQKSSARVYPFGPIQS